MFQELLFNLVMMSPQSMIHDDSGESVGIEEGSNGQQSNGFIGGSIQLGVNQMS